MEQTWVLWPWWNPLAISLQAFSSSEHISLGHLPLPLIQFLFHRNCATGMHETLSIFNVTFSQSISCATFNALFDNETPIGQRRKPRVTTTPSSAKINADIACKPTIKGRHHSNACAQLWDNCWPGKIEAPLVCRFCLINENIMVYQNYIFLLLSTNWVVCPNTGRY